MSGLFLAGSVKGRADIKASEVRTGIYEVVYRKVCDVCGWAFMQKTKVWRAGWRDLRMDLLSNEAL